MQQKRLVEWIRLTENLCINNWGRHFKPQYDCVQYSNNCQSWIVKNYSVPLQHAYIDAYTKSGFETRPGNGGFFFSFYMGVYMEAGINGTKKQIQLIQVRNTLLVWNPSFSKNRVVLSKFPEWIPKKVSKVASPILNLRPTRYAEICRLWTSFPVPRFWWTSIFQELLMSK